VSELEAQNRELIEMDAAHQVNDQTGKPTAIEERSTVRSNTSVAANNFDQPIVNQDVSGASVAQAALAAPGAIAGNGHYGLHLASYRSLSRLGSGWQQLQNRYPELLGGLGAITVVLDVPGLGGAYQRLIAGPVVDELTANSLCEALKASREYCVVAEFDADLERIE